jgi:hypothetical protein
VNLIRKRQVWDHRNLRLGPRLHGGVPPSADLELRLTNRGSSPSGTGHLQQCLLVQSDMARAVGLDVDAP